MNSGLGFLEILTIFYLTHYLLGIGTVSGEKQYSAKEYAALEEFRPLVQNILYRDYMKEDKFLIRWLRSRDLNVIKARAMLEKAIKWRKENKIDTILNETILTLPVIPFYNDGISYSLNPISTVNIRAFDLRNLILGGKRAEVIGIWDQALETGECGLRYMSERFPPIHQIHSILDFNGYNQRQHGCQACLLVFQEWTRHYEDYYPFMADKTFIVNAPRSIKPLIRAFKPFLSPHSQKGLKVFGQNHENWREEILKIVPRNQLRKSLGGTRPDRVPCLRYDFHCMCKQFFKAGGPATNTTITFSGEPHKFNVEVC